MASTLPGGGYTHLGLCLAQLVLGVTKAIGVSIPAFLLLGLAQLAAAAAVAYNSFSLVLPALTSPGGGDADLSTPSAYIYLFAAALAAAVVVVDICVSFAYVSRGVATDDPAAAFKALVIFSLASIVTILAAITLKVSWAVGDVQIVDLADSFVDVAAIICCVALGLSAGGVVFVAAMSLVNLCSSMGNRRFALTWFVMYFVVTLPAGVIFGIAGLRGSKTVEDVIGSAAGFVYIAVSVYFPLLSLGFAISKEAFVLEKYKNGDVDMAF